MRIIIKLAICLLLGVLNISSISSAEYFIEPRVYLSQDPFEGWGTSLAWFADVIGGFDEEVVEEITQAFFSPEKLNFNIVRYVIGGTTPWNLTCGPYRDGAGSETFLDGPEYPYDWTRDPRQRLILEKAKNLGADIFEAFSNSPPQWLTISGCTKGNPVGGLLHGNFDPSNSRQFADYLTEVIHYFHENLGITFQYISPFNEPMGLGGIGGWFPPQTTQEGCNMDRETMSVVIETLYDVIQEKGMDYLTITTADETQVNTAIGTQEYFHEKGLAEKISKINVHGYWDLPNNRRDELYIISQKAGQKLWMDEMGWEGTLDNMNQGLEISRRIIKDIRDMLPTAWVYWQALESVGAWGIITLDYQNPTLENIQYNSGYYAMMQFSHYIKKDFMIIHVNNDQALAAYHLETKTLVLVILNSGVEISEEIYDLGGFSHLGPVKCTRSSISENHAEIQDCSELIGSKLHYLATPESITTIVISETEFNIDGQNLVLNGDFENSQHEVLNSWTLDPSNGVDNGISNKYPFRGDSNGHVGLYLIPNLSLSQTISAPEDGAYFLSAWSSIYGFVDNAHLQVSVNGVVVQEVKIKPFGYRIYGLGFEARQNDQIKIILTVTKGLGVDIADAFLDDVSLYLAHNL